MHLTVSLPGCGAHPAAWRETAVPHAPSLRWFQSLVALAERGCFDAAFFAHHPWGPVLARSGLVQSMQVDSLPLIVALAECTTHIGLGGAITLDHAEPFNIARSFAGADRLTAGRTAWITGLASPMQRPGNFGHGPALTLQQRYARGEECIAVVRKLWDSWEDEAIILDKAAGLFSNPDRIHRIDHAGNYFSVRGPLNAPRPLQGHPVIVQWDATPGGLALASRTADIFLAAAATPAALEPVRAGLGPTPRLLATLVPLLAPTAAEAEARAASLDARVTGELAAAIRADHGCDDPVGRAWSMAGIPFIGTPGGLAEMMAGMLADRACDGFNIAPAVAPTDLALFVGGVVPLLQARGLLRRCYAHGTLRETLGLARPPNQFAAA